MYCCDFTIYDMIVRNAGLYPEKSALVYGDNRISFSDYKKLCDQCAASLIKEGIDVGDRIAVLSSNNDDFLILCGASAKIGAVVVPVNYRLDQGEVEYILKDSTPKYIFSSKEYKELARKASSAVGSIQKRYVFKADKNEGDFIPFGTLLLDVKITQSDAVSGNHAYMIIHTAAVGGKPRGCVLGQANMLAVGFQIAHMFKLTSSDCHVGTLPLFHIGGFSTTLAVMHQGGKNLIMDRFDPLVVLKLIEKEQGTFFGTFPPILATILDAQDKQSFDTSSLRGVGGLDGPETIQRFLNKNPQAVFYSVYGQTECMPVSGCDIMEKPGSIGLPAVMTRVGIFDDLDREVPIGGQGEICVRSPAVFLGYLNLEADTAYTFRNGWHHTGDFGRIDKDGFIWFAGRKPEKELIKPGGENVYPAEVEKVILEQGDVAKVSVIGVPDVQWGEAIKAVCVLKPDRSLEPQALIDFVASKIAHYKKPKYVVFVNSLPKTKEGEIDRDQVKKAHGGKY
jgi:acyl-CoA synthetase (AMP-forming)/AMP-acid ligase II